MNGNQPTDDSQRESEQPPDSSTSQPQTNQPNAAGGSQPAPGASSESGLAGSAAAPSNPNQQDRALDEKVSQAIDSLAEEYLIDLRRGKAQDYKAIAAAHPELAPHLEARLKFCLAVFKAARQTKSTAIEDPSEATVELAKESSATILQREASFRISCPHCGNQVQVVGERVREVVCGSCGSSVRVNPATSRRLADIKPAPMPETLEHFRIKRILGEGGFGIVYLAEDLQLDRRPVAIKIPRYGFFASTDEEQRFFREALHVARLRHPNIAQVYEISQDRNTPFIVSEFIDGLTLRDLARSSTLSQKESVQLLIQVAEAVEYAHRQRIVHRDLKTSNIIVDHDHKAYVVDFGLSRRDDAEITMTVEGTIVGTVQYMSPEQAVGNLGEVGPRSDVYSMGVILYELLCKELPFHGTKRMLLNQVINDEPRSPRRLNENVPRDLETIALKAMAKKPSQRYASAQEFADDMKRWLRGEPIMARPIGSVARYWNWCRRHPTTASLSAAIVALVLLSTGIAFGWAFEQTRLTGLERVARSESQARQYELLMHNGMRAMDENDLARSAFWFAEALKIRDNATNRLRLGLIEDRLPKLEQLGSFESPIDTLRFNSDGTRVAIGSYAGRLHVYDLQNRQEIFNQPAQRFSHLDFAAKGDRAVTCGYENHAELWDIAGRKLVKRLAHTNVVLWAEWDATGKWLATAGLDSFARLWSADGALQAERKFETSQVRRVTFGPQPNQVIVVTHEPGQTSDLLHIWDTATDQMVASGLEHDSIILALDIVDEGKKICTATRTGQLNAWDASSGQRIGQAVSLPFAPRQVLFDRNGQSALVVSYDFDVQTFDLANGQPQGPQIRPTGNYRSIEQNPAAQLMALNADDGAVSIYWRQTGTEACSRLRNSPQTSAVAFHPDGRRLVMGSATGVLQIWDLAGSVASSFVFQHSGPVRNALFTSDGQRCVTAGGNQALLWNAETGQQMDGVLEHAGPIIECDVSLDGRMVATASADKTARLWDALKGGAIGNPLAHESTVTAIAISPDGNRLATGCADGTVKGWEVKSASQANPVAVFTGTHSGRVMHIRFNAGGDLIASSGYDGTVRCWDAVTGQQKFGPFQHRNTAFFSVFLPDGQRLVSCGSDGWANIWNLASGEVEQRLECSSNVNSAVLFDAGRRILTNDTGGRTRAWNIEGGRADLELEMQHPLIESAQYAAADTDGTIFVMAGGALAQGDALPKWGALVLWDAVEKRQLAPPLEHRAMVRRAYFHPTRRQLLSASSDRTARLWRLVANDLPRQDAIRRAGLIAQLKTNEEGRPVELTPGEQRSLFVELSTEHPAFFRCDAEEIKLWTDDANRLHSEVHSTSGDSVARAD